MKNAVKHGMTPLWYLYPILLVFLILPFNARSEGLDKTYFKPDKSKLWTQRFAERIGYDSGFSKSYALVVGISKFTDHKDLPTEKDPLKVRDFLLASGFDEVHVLTEEKVTLARLRRLMLDDFPKKIDENDRFLLYWSGHGVERDIAFGGQAGYLPLASSGKERYSSMASMDDVARWDGLLKARHTLYLVDACFSGLAGVVSLNTQAKLVVDQMLKPARFLLTAGTAKEETIASDQWGGSLFTHALLSGLTGAADASTSDFPSDGVISLLELVSHIRKRVAVERTKKNWQKAITPQLRDLRGSDGEFFFLTSKIKNTTPTPDPSEDPAPIVSQSGQDIPPPDEKNKAALAAYEKCDGGEARSCGNLGYMYDVGEGVAQDDAKAVSLYRQGCDGGDAISCANLGLMYDIGKGVAQDDAKAVSLYRQGCDGGNARSCGNLGYMYDIGKGVAQDDAKAVSLYRQGCDGGEARSCGNLGFMYEKGKGVAQDDAKAVSLYRQGCDGGNALSCGNLGYMYDIGKGVAQDYAKAVSLYRQGCEGGDARSCGNLGLMYEKGKGVEEGYAKAVSLYRQACDGGNAISCGNLGLMYSQGKGVAQDDAKAVSLYRQACDGGNAISCGRI